MDRKRYDLELCDGESGRCWAKMVLSEDGDWLVYEKSRCAWSYDEWHDVWYTDCGNAFVLINGTPVENDMRYCPYCGNLLWEKK